MGAAEVKRDPAQLRRMFGAISGRYVLMNRIITLGLDVSWRRRLLKAAPIPRGGMLLDAGSGTGDTLLAALAKDPELRAVALDFTLEMMLFGRQRKGAGRVLWCCGNALSLPFPDAVFDGVVSAYLLRNAEDVKGVLREQVRVVKPGGPVAVLDTSPPPPGLVRPAVLFYFRFVIPLLGQVIARDRSAYEYLPSSTRRFLRPDEIARIMQEEGLKEVKFQRFMLGTQVVASGIRGRR